MAAFDTSAQGCGGRGRYECTTELQHMKHLEWFVKRVISSREWVRAAGA